MHDQVRGLRDHILRGLNAFGNALFGSPMAGLSKAIHGGGLIALYVAGSGAIYYLLNGGVIQLNLHDWAEVTAPRYAFLQDAVTKGLLPLHMPGEWGLRNVTDRFLAVPDTNLGPQIIALRYLELDRFFLFQTWLLYSAGFLGLILLAGYLRLSLLAFGILFGMLFFNGNIIDHVVVGHVNWAVNFLIPFFAYLILRLIDDWRDRRWVASMAVFLFALLLQGAFHLFVACSFFLGLLWLVSSEVRRPIFWAGLFAAGLSAARLLPPVLEFQSFDTAFLSGYPTTLDLAEALIVLRPTYPEFVFSSSGLTNLNWWEFDLYVGLVGTLLLLVFGIKGFTQSSGNRPSYRVLALPILGMTALSIGRVYKIFHWTQIPLLASQRVSSRLIFVPFAVLVVLAVVELQRWLNRSERPLSHKAGLFLASLLIANDLWQHTNSWRVVNMGRLFPPKEFDIAVNTVANHPDPDYFLLLTLGTGISALSAVLLGLWLLREKSRTAPADTEVGRSDR